MNMMILALGLAIAGTPAASPQNSDQAAAGAGAQATRNAAAAPERKYCIAYEDITGSRTSGGTVCRTKAQWAREGIDVDHPSTSS